MEKGINLVLLILITLATIVAMIFAIFLFLDVKAQTNEVISPTTFTTSTPVANNEVHKEVIPVESKSIEGKYSHNEYQKKIDEIAEEFDAVGLSVALVDEGKVIDTFAYGDAIKGNLQMSEDTKVRIASVSKIFVGLATMISVENGTMTLDEDISKYWGFDIPKQANGDTLSPRAILTHTSSLYDSEDVDDTYYNYVVYRLKSGNGIRNLVSGNIENYYYNNYAIDVLGSTIELANNKTLDEILAERLYNKLDIDAAFYAGDLKDTSNMATCYQADGSIGLAASRNATWHRGEPAYVGWGFAGSLTISAKDLGKIIALIANDGIYEGTRYLSDKSIKELENHENNYVSSENFWQCQPLCYKKNVYGQKEFYYHTGGAYGIYSLAGYNPDTKQGVAILTSGAYGQDDENNITEICGKIANLLLNIK